MPTKVNVQGKPFFKIMKNAVKSELQALIPRTSIVQWITLHWTAGSYITPYKDYQILISPDYILVSADVLNFDRHQHTYHRNTGNVGVSFMAMADGYEVLPQMMETAGEVLAFLKESFGLAWSRLQDHAFWAKMDGYTHLRWDVRRVLKDAEAKALGLSSETVFERCIRKAKWYYQKIFEAKAQPANLLTDEREHEEELKKAGPINQGPKIFDDVPNTLWSSEAIEQVYKMELLVGSKTDKGHLFKPNQPLQRQEFAVALNKYDKLIRPRSPDEKHWAYKRVKALHDAGVLQGSRSQDGKTIFDLFRPVDMGTAIIIAASLLNKSAQVQQVFNESA